MNNINKLGGIEKKLDHLWLDACKANPRRIVFPEATDLRTLEAIARLVRDKATREIFVVGDQQSSIRAASANQTLCRELESGVTWTSDKIPDLAKQTQQIIEKNAAHRGKILDPANAEALSKDPLFQAGAKIPALQLETPKLSIYGPNNALDHCASHLSFTNRATHPAQ